MFDLFFNNFYIMPFLTCLKSLTEAEMNEVESWLEKVKKKVKVKVKVEV